ncbi:MAG: chalcone isomerase family protein [Pseudomonadota bacterium]
MRKFGLFLLTFLTIGFTENVKAYEYISIEVPEPMPVGKGRLTWMFWDVYDVTLFAPKGQFEDEPPFALSLTYLRKLDGKEIADRSAEEMRRLGMNDEVKLATWHNQMRQIFPDVSKGKRLTGVYNRDKVSIFYEDGKEIGRIQDSEFGSYFFDIWLAKETKKPTLRAQLLGVQ